VLCSVGEHDAILLQIGQKGARQRTHEAALDTHTLKYLGSRRIATCEYGHIQEEIEGWGWWG
jgi:hypothetical protein